DERRLAKRMEEGKVIREVREALQNQLSQFPPADEVLVRVYDRLRQNWPILVILKERVGAPASATVLQCIQQPAVRNLVDHDLDPELVGAVAGALSASADEAERRLIEFSIDTRVLASVEELIDLPEYLCRPTLCDDGQLRGALGTVRNLLDVRLS